MGDLSQESQIICHGLWHLKRHVAVLRFSSVVLISEVYLCAADVQPLPSQSRMQTSLPKDTQSQQPQQGTEQAIRFIVLLLTRTGDRFKLKCPIMLGCSTGTDDDTSDQLASKVAAESPNTLIIGADSSCARYIARELHPKLCISHKAAATVSHSNVLPHHLAERRALKHRTWNSGKPDSPVLAKPHARLHTVSSKASFELSQTGTVTHQERHSYGCVQAQMCVSKQLPLSQLLPYNLCPRLPPVKINLPVKERPFLVCNRLLLKHVASGMPSPVSQP